MFRSGALDLVTSSSNVDHLEWDVSTWSQALTCWLTEGRIPLRGARVLEIGGRHGGMALWLAEQGADVVCSDLGGPSAKAVALHGARGVSPRMSYVDLDATAMSYDREFDVVVFKSVLGSVGGGAGIEGQRAMIGGIRRALRPGGELLFAENLAGPAMVRFLRRKFVPWNEGWLYSEPEVLTEMLSCFATTMTTFGTLALLGRTEAQRKHLSSLDRHLLDRLGGPSWRYVAAGVARKE